MEAYTYISLVDYVGDVPYSQANQFGDFPTPALRSWCRCICCSNSVVKHAISNLSQESAVIPQDLFYGSFDADNWIAVANTLKLKAHLNMGDGAAISALLSRKHY